MTQQRVCDECGQPIDETVPFWTGSAQKQSSPVGPISDDGPPVAFDFHEDHLPWTPTTRGVSDGS